MDAIRTIASMHSYIHHQKTTIMIKVLIADDHQIVLDGIRAFLEKENNIEVVAEALNGREVLKTLENTPVDIAVLDIGMPEMDGIETTKAIRKNFPGVKVLILTMYDDGAFINGVQKAGAYGYLLKDRSKEALVGALHAIQNGRTYYPPAIIDRMAESNGDGEKEDVQLTAREGEVLSLVGEALSAKEIADKLDIAEVTAVTHIRNLRGKLDITNVQGLVRYAIKHGYTKL